MTKAIRDVDWQVGSTNNDDDFHTDVQFLRVSVRRLQAVAGMAHDAALLHYRNFRGTFYYSTSATSALCATLIDRLKKDRRWAAWLVTEILRRSDDLWKVFDGLLPESDCWNALVTLYERQLEAHACLYEVCWIPEILQAQNVGLTDYLYQHLQAKLPSKADVHHAFVVLTFDTERSGAFTLNESLLSLAEYIRREAALMALFGQPLRYLRLNAPSWLRREAESLSAEYGYLTYHGYGDRHVQSADEILERLQKLVCHDLEREALRSVEGNRKALYRERTQLVRSLRLDAIHLRLFRLEARFATLKLRRRLTQLKNFYFLDRLLGRFAERLDQPERTVRFMLPEEIIHYVTTGTRVPRSIVRRFDGMLYYVDRRSERILTTSDALAFAERLQPRLNDAEVEMLRGQPASIGSAAGRAVVVFRAEDAARSDFSAGDILVLLCHIG